MVYNYYYYYYARGKTEKKKENHQTKTFFKYAQNSMSETVPSNFVRI